MEEKRYPILDEEESVGMVSEPVAVAEAVEITMPDNLDYAQVVNSVLQITPDIEEEISEVERGETVSLSEFKTIFAKWLD